MQAALVSCAPFWEANRDGSCNNSWLQSLLPHLRKVMTEAERSPMRCHLGTLEGNRWLVVHGAVFPLSLTQVIYRKMSETLDRSLTKEASGRIFWTLQTVPCCFPQLGTRDKRMFCCISDCLCSSEVTMPCCAWQLSTQLRKQTSNPKSEKNSLQIQYLSTMHNFSQAFLWTEYARNHS